MTKHLVEIEAVLTASTSQFRQALDRDLAGFQQRVVTQAAATKTPGVSATSQIASQQGAIEAQLRQQHSAGKIGDERLASLLREVDQFFARLAGRAQAQLRNLHNVANDVKVKPPSRDAVDAAADKHANRVARETAETAARRRAEADRRAVDDVQRGRGRGLSAAQNERFRRDVTPTKTGDFTTAPAFERTQLMGETAALERLFGLAVGVAQVLEESKPPLAAGLRTLRANLTALRAFAEANERAAEQQALYNSLAGSTENDLAAATSRLALIRERRALLEGEATLRGTAPLVNDQGRARAAARIRRAEIELAELETLAKPGATGDRAKLGQLQAARQELADATRAEAARVRRSTASGVQSAARAQDEAALTRRVINEQRTAEFRARGGMEEGSWWQRRQASIANRQGGAPRSPLEFQTGRQFLESKAITTAGFALSGGLLYGALSLGGDIFRESTELQQELAIIRTQFESLDSTAKGITFDKFRRQIQDTAVDTGVAANEVANVQRQLAGAFADQQGNPNFDLAASEGRVALQYSKVSGLPQQEITDSLTATSLAFRTVTDDGREIPLQFSEILDIITDLENRFGVLGPEILKFTADLAPLGKELGLTAEQLAGLGAVAQQASGKSGSVLAEQLGRILPSFADKADELGQVLAANPNTRGDAAKLAVAADTGQTADALKILIENYSKLNDAQKRQLATLVGGRREAATFYALLDRGNQTLAVLSESSDSAAGSFSKRWDEYKKTVTYAFEQVRRTVERFGQQLFEAGIADALVGAADAAKIFLGVASSLLSVIGQLNSALGGLPGRALGVYAALKLISALWSASPLAGRTAGSAGISALMSPTIALPAGVAGPQQLRPGVAAAMNSSIGSRLLSRDAAGVVTSGAGTAITGGAFSLASVLGPIAVTMALSYGVQQYMSLKGELEQAKKTDKESIRAMLDRGVSPERIKQAIDEAADGSRDDGWKGDITSALRLSQTDNRYEILFQELTRDELDPLAAGLEVVANATGDRGRELRRSLGRSLRENFGKGPYGSDPKVRAKLAEIFKIDKGNFGDGSVGIEGYDPSTAQVTEDTLNRLLSDIRKDPTSKVLLDTANFLLSLPGADEYRQRINEAIAYAQGQSDSSKALTDLVEGKGKKAEEGSAEFEAKLRNRQSAATSGRSSIQPVLKLIRERIAEYTGLYNDAKAMGTQAADEVAAGYAAQIDELNKQLYGTVVSDADALTAYRENVNKTIGRTGLEAAMRAAAAAADSYKQKANTPETTSADRGNAALVLLEKQRELLEARIAGATDPAKIDQILAQSGGISPQLRQDVIAGSLSYGQNAAIIERIAAAIGEDSEYVRSLISEAFTQNRDIEKSAIFQTAKARLAVLDEIGASGIHMSTGSDPWTEDEWNSYFDEYNRLSGLVNSLPDLNKLTPEDPGNEQAAGELAAKTARVNARNIAKSLLPSSDKLGALRLDLENARDEFDATKPETEERIAATIALNEAQRAYDEGLTENAQSLAEAAANLTKSRNPGNALAAAQADLRVAQAMMARAKTDIERMTAQAAVNNALNAAEDAVNQQLQARGDYLANLLEGDSVAQAEQVLATARQALATARPDERYNALSAVLDAQRALQAALLDVFISQKDLAIAVAEGAGDTVRVALLQLEQAKARLDAAKRAGLQGAQLSAAQAEVQRAQNNVVNVQRQDRLGDLEYLYEFDKITAQRYIALLKAELQKIPESNKDARREIERRIKALRDELGADLTMNLPSEIKLPLLYEARRLNQIAQLGQQAGSYQDNRIGSVQIIIPDAGSPEATAQLVAQALNNANRSSLTGSPGILVGLGG